MVDVDSFKIIYSIDSGEGSFTSKTFILNDSAVQMLPESEEVEIIFDLTQMSWQNEGGRTIDFSACEAWVKAGDAKARRTLATMEEGVEKRFVQSVLKPDFAVDESTDGGLTLENEFFIYRIAPLRSVPADWLEKFYTLDRLRAYPNNPAARKAVRAQAKCRNAM